MQDNKFDAIYKKQIWSGQSDLVPLSGPGSMVESSLPVIDFINEAIDTNRIRTVLDLGCGDLTYISTIDSITSGAVRYTGVDVSDYILQENTKRYPWFEGTCKDITESQTYDADLILIKDLLFHLTNNQISLLFDNLARSRFTYCIVTTMNNKSNRNRKLDQKHNYANVNIRISPFFRNQYLQALDRPKSANEGMKDQGEFLIYDMESFNASANNTVRKNSVFRSVHDRLWRLKGR